MSEKIRVHRTQAPCGMDIRYTTDTWDCVDKDNINGRGEGMLSPTCNRCGWKGICRPTPPETETFRFEMELIFSEEQLEILWASYDRAKKQGFTGSVGEYVEHLANIGACTTLLEIAKNL